MIYSFIGIFRRTPFGSYFYENPCAMNKMAFLYTALALLLYIPQLLPATDNTYYGLVREKNQYFDVILVFNVILGIITSLY